MTISDEQLVEWKTHIIRGWSLLNGEQRELLDAVEELGNERVIIVSHNSALQAENERLEKLQLKYIELTDRLSGYFDQPPDYPATRVAELEKTLKELRAENEQLEYDNGYHEHDLRQQRELTANTIQPWKEAVEIYKQVMDKQKQTIAQAREIVEAKGDYPDSINPVFNRLRAALTGEQVDG